MHLLLSGAGGAEGWLNGITPFRELIAEGHVRLVGPSRLARAFPTWFMPSVFAPQMRQSARRASSQTP